MEINNAPEALARYRKIMESFAPLSDDDFQQLAGVMHEKHCNKGEVLMREGQVCNKYYFILKGCSNKPFISLATFSALIIESKSWTTIMNSSPLIRATSFSLAEMV